MQINGSKVLVTGGSRGIGKATALMLAQEGARVAITGRDQKPLEEAAGEIPLLPFRMDVSDPDDVDRTFKKVMEKFGKLDVLINNAGTGIHQELEELSIDKMKEIFAVNVYGATMMAQKATVIFKKQKYGNIINIGSTAGVRGYPGGSSYVASKFALRGLTDCWKKELRKFNIRVFLVNPSEVQTAFGKPGKKIKEVPNKLRSREIATTIKSLLELDDRGFIPEVEVWATNPW